MIIKGKEHLCEYNSNTAKLDYKGPKDPVNTPRLTQEEFEEAMKEKPKRFCKCGQRYRKIGRHYYCNGCHTHFNDKSPVVDEVNGKLDKKLNPPPKAEDVLPLPASDCPDVCIECENRGGPSFAYCNLFHTHIWTARREEKCTYDYVDSAVDQEKDKDQ